MLQGHGVMVSLAGLCGWVGLLVLLHIQVGLLSRCGWGSHGSGGAAESLWVGLPWVRWGC